MLTPDLVLDATAPGGYPCWILRGVMKEPFYQGKIDNFCAIYAVLNAVQLLHNLSATQARNIFNLFLVQSAMDTRHFWDMLTHRTDYVRDVDILLGMIKSTYPLKVEAPFSGAEDCRDLWRSLTGRADAEHGSVVLFRFMRYKAGNNTPSIDHWSCAGRTEEGFLPLFDCSLEASGLYRLSAGMLESEVAERPREYVIIPPKAVRFVSLP